MQHAKQHISFLFTSFLFWSVFLQVSEAAEISKPPVIQSQAMNSATLPGLGLGLRLALTGPQIVFHDRFEPVPVEDRILQDVDHLEPGMFTRFDGGLLIGAHPFAIEDDLEIHVDWIDPSDNHKSSFDEMGVTNIGTFIEITATGTDDHWITTPSETGFFIGIPVPETFDHNHLVAATFSHIDHLVAREESEINRQTDEPEGDWLWKVGVYDPDYQMLFIQVESIGSDRYPTRIGLLEHETWPTKWQTPYIEPLATSHFPKEENTRLSGNSSSRQHSGSSRIHDSGRTEWSTCVIDTCPPAEDEIFEEIVGEIICWPVDNCPADLSFFKEPLKDSIPHYLNLHGHPSEDPKPELQTLWNPVTEQSHYLYNIHNEDTYATYTTCGEHYSGRYWAPDKEIVTCLKEEENDAGEMEFMETDMQFTTAHELFHAFQWSYWDVGFPYDGVLLEATASYAETLWLPIAQPRYSGPNISEGMKEITEELTGTNLTYRWSHFYYHLISDNSSIDFEDLGHILVEGNDFDAIESALGWSQLRDFYWHFVRDYAFETTHFQGEDACTLSQQFLDGGNYTSNTGGPQTAPEGDKPEDFNVSTNVGAELSTSVREIDLYGGDTYEPYTMTVRSEGAQEHGDGNWRIKAYDALAADYEETGCLSDELEASTVEIDVYNRSKTVYLIVSNMDPVDPEIEHYFEFDYIPEEDLPHKVQDFEVEFPQDNDGSPSINIPVTDRVDPEPHSLSELVIDHPGDTSEVTELGNRAITLESGEEGEPGELHFKLEDDYPDEAVPEYTDTFVYEIRNERYELTDTGTISVYRNLRPIGNDIGFNLVEVDPAELDPHTNDINPLDYSFSPYEDLNLYIDSIEDANNGTASINSDGMTFSWAADSWESSESAIFEYFDVQDIIEKMELEDELEQYETAITNQVDEFGYTLRNVIEEGGLTAPDLSGFDSARIALFQEEIVHVVQEDDHWDTIFNAGLHPDDVDVQRHFEHCYGNQGMGGHLFLSVKEDDQQSVFYRSDQGGEWTNFGAEISGDVALADVGFYSSVVGWIDSGREIQAIIGDDEGVIMLPSDGSSRALGVNESDDVVGHAVFGSSEAEAVLWRTDGTFSLDQGWEGLSAATSINNNDQVIGLFGIDSGGARLGDLTGDSCGGFLNSISNQLLADQASSFFHDFSETGNPPEGNITVLPDLGGGSSVATDMNDQGMVVGVSRTASREDSPDHAFLWSEGQGIQDLGTLGGSYSIATGINGQGYVVGSSLNGDGEKRGFIWHPDEGMLDMNDLTLLPKEWTLTEVTGFTAEGELLVNVRVTDTRQWPLVVSDPFSF